MLKSLQSSDGALIQLFADNIEKRTPNLENLDFGIDGHLSYIEEVAGLRPIPHNGNVINNAGAIRGVLCGTLLPNRQYHIIYG